MMAGPIQLKIIALIVAGVFAVGLVLHGVAPEKEWFSYYSWAGLIVSAVLGIWDSWVWGTWLGQIFPNVPVNLSGTWKGVLTTMWKGDNGNTPPAKTAYLVVRQTFSRISIVLITDESVSKSSLAAFTADDTGSSLSYMYLNKPDIHLHEVSRIHHGSTTLDVSGRPATRLKGSYWTDRKSQGALDFTSRKKAKVQDFDAAERLFLSR